LEGIDGAGTTTQLRLIDEHCKSAGIPHVCTFEPTDFSTGKAIRTILKGEQTVEPSTIAYLFSADRNEHLYNKTAGILQYLAKGVLVVCDRYLFSSLAYQSVNCDFPFVYELNRNFPLPGNLVFLDVPVEVCSQRLNSRSSRDIYETDSFQHKVLAGYNKALAAFADTPMVIHRFDGTEPVETVFQKIWKIIASLPINTM